MRRYLSLRGVRLATAVFAGCVLTHSGAWAAPAQTVPPAGWLDAGWSLRARTGQYGASVCTADVDADGYDDLIAGAPDAYTKISNVNNDYGQVVVYRGSATGLVFEAGATRWYWAAQGTVLNGRFGQKVAAGDVNNDAASDILVSAAYSAAGTFGRGKVQLFKGRPFGTPETTAAWSYEGAADWQSVGAAICMTDLNADGLDDVALCEGFPTFGLTAKVQVFYGTANGLPAAPDWTLTFDMTSIVSSLAGADVNGDGIQDLVIGSPFKGDITGYVYVFFGSKAGLKPAPTPANADNTLSGGQSFGQSLANAGRVNADAADDVVIGEPTFGNPKAYIVFGSVGVGLSNARHELPSDGGNDPNWGSDHGRAVTSVGRFNNDEYDDVAVGDPSYATLAFMGGCDPELNPACAAGEIKGKVFVYYGSANAHLTGMTPGPSFGHPYTVVENSFGNALAFGRFNGDAGGDLVVGAPAEGSVQNLVGQGAGAVYVYYGAVIPFGGSDDADGDGLPDAWEKLYGGMDRYDRGGADYDKDGATDTEEWLAGTEPDNPLSRLRIESVALDAPGHRLQWQSATGHVYSVLHTFELKDKFVTELTNNIAAEPPLNTVTVTPPDGARHFYRIRSTRVR